MSVNFHNKTLSVYLDLLASRAPVPGGGSAAALSAALGVALISMVTNYSIGRKTNTKDVERRLVKILNDSEAIRARLLVLTSLDSDAYLNIVKARTLDAAAQKQASKEAAAVGNEVCKLCYKAIDPIPYLIVKGNPYLISDLDVAGELLHAGFNASMVMVRINQ